MIRETCCFYPDGEPEPPKVRLAMEALRGLSRNPKLPDGKR